MSIRIDTVRNRVSGLAELAQKILEELDELHHLAYDRDHARAERVAGGQPDYALDNHGDPAARAALAGLSDASIRAARQFEIQADIAIELLRRGPSPERKRRSEITAVELAVAILARARRIERGDFSPARRTPQLGQLAALEGLKRDNERLTRELAEAKSEVIDLRNRNDDLAERARPRWAIQ